MYLFLDLGTSGLVRSDIYLEDPAQPFALKIAAEHTMPNGDRLSAIDLLIKPEGRAVKPKAYEVHGISSRIAENFGFRENLGLMFLADVVKAARVVVTFSSFDPLVIESLMIRLAISLGKPPETFSERWKRPGLTFLNIQHPAAQQATKAESGFDTGEYRWPTLDAACAAVLGLPPREGKHDAWLDLARLKQLFFVLRDRGHFPFESA
jgi:hypothetical protein